MSKKVLLVADLSTLSQQKNNGYTHRILNISKVYRDNGYVVYNLWFYRIQNTFGLKKSYLYCCKVGNNIFLPILPLFRSGFFGYIGRWMAKMWLLLVDNLIHFDIIQFENVYIYSCLPKRISNKIKISDFHGDVVSEMKVNGLNKRKSDQLNGDEKSAFVNSDGIVTVSASLKNVLTKRHGLGSLNHIIAPCGVSMSRFENVKKDRRESRSHLGIENKIVFVYLGGLYKWQLIEETVSIFANIYKFEKRSYLLIITNSNVKDCKKKLQDFGVDKKNYGFLSLSGEEVPMYLPVGDFGFLLRENNPVNVVSSPTKTGEYLASGMPIITTKYAGDASEIISKSGCGYIINDLSGVNYEEIIRYVEKINLKREYWFERCIESARNYQSWEHSSKALMTMIKKITDSDQIN